MIRLRWLSVLPALLILAACPPTKNTADAGTDAGASAPHVTTVFPSSGPLAGGTDVSITGANFEDGVRVFFGTVEGENVTWVTKGRLTARTPPGSVAGPVDVKVQNADGQSDTLLGGFTYEAPTQKTISNAVLNNAATQSIASANATEAVNVIAEVTVPLVTDGAGAGAGVKAQVGYGAANADPASSSAFTWVDAAYSGDTGSAQESDQYSGSVSLPVPTDSSVVTYSLAARFSVDDGVSWVVADRDGSSNGATNAQLAKVTVSKPMIDWCKLGGVATGVEALDLRTNQSGAAVYGQVYQANVTTSAGEKSAISAQLGYGAAGTDPSTWTWVNAAFNADKGNNDEYQATLTNPGVGTYKYAYRVALNNGPWKYCDGNGSDDGFSEANAGTLTVTSVQVDRCNLQYPANLVSTIGSTTPTIYGRVKAVGVTDASGAPSGLSAEVGYGSAGTQPDAWTSWTSAAFNIDVDATTDEFKASFATPAAGSYRYAYRFKIGAGGTWTYCDLDGSDVGGYTEAQAGKLDVPTFTDCKLLVPTQTTVASGAALDLKAQVYGAGLTTTAGAASGIKAQIGIGAPQASANQSTLWGWGDATYVQDVSGWDEYKLTAHPAYNGSRAVAARFSSDNGQSWLYCDLNGYQTGGFEQSQQQALTVNTTSDIDWCRLQSPATAVFGTATDVYGQVREDPLTGTANSSNGTAVTAQLGYGPSVEDPGVSTRWTWVNATWNASCSTCGTTNDEYSATLPASVPSGMAYAYRFVRASVGTYCFADLNGNGANTGLGGNDGAFSGENGSQANLGQVVP